MAQKKSVGNPGISFLLGVKLEYVHFIPFQRSCTYPFSPLSYPFSPQ